MNTKIKITYNNSTQPQKDFVAKIIDMELLACQSMLVEEMLKNDIVSYDEIENLYSHDISAEGNVDDEIMQEIFEWHLLSGWYVADQLIKLDEPVLKTPYGMWWGRTCTGQNIIIDPTFWIIYQEQIIKE